MRWFSSSTRRRKPSAARRGLTKAGITFTDDEGNRWNVSVFRRSSVGAWWSREQWEWSHKLAVVFEHQGEERVAIVDWNDDWNSAGGLGRLLARATERRSGQERRNIWKSVFADRRSRSDRRWTAADR